MATKKKAPVVRPKKQPSLDGSDIEARFSWLWQRIVDKIERGGASLDDATYAAGVLDSWSRHRERRH